MALENAMIPTPIPAEEPLVDLVRPMAGLVFHYNKAETAICETTGMVETNSRVSDILQGILDTNLKKVVVLVSPTYYQQRKHFYGSDPKYRVLPLLFKWSKLTAVQLKKLMKLDDRDNQLYVGLMLSKLRGKSYPCPKPEPRFHFVSPCLTFSSLNSNGPLARLRRLSAER